MIEPNDDVDGGTETAGAELFARWPATLERTGDPAVDAVLQRLEGIPAARVEEHGALYEGIHDDLMTVLDSDPSAAAAAGSQKTDDDGGA